MPQAACKALAPRHMPSRHMSVSRSGAHGPIRGRQNGNHIRVILVAADTHVRCGSLTVADGAADRRRRSSHTLAAAARSLNIDVIMYAFLLSLSRHGRGIIYKSKLDFRLFWRSLQRAALARCQRGDMDGGNRIGRHGGTDGHDNADGPHGPHSLHGIVAVFLYT